jgi:WD40 repeat protein
MNHTVSNSEAAAYRPLQQKQDATHELAYVAGHTVILYDETQEKPSRIFVGRQGHQINCISWHPDASRLFGGESGNNAAVIIWDGHTGHCIDTLLPSDKDTGTVTHVRLSPLTDLLLVVSDDVLQVKKSVITLWRMSDRKLVWKQKADAHVQCVTWNNTGTFFALGGAQFLKVYNIIHNSASGIDVRIDLAHLGRDARQVNCSADLVSLVFGSVWKDISRPIKGASSEPNYIRVPDVMIALSRHGKGNLCVFQHVPKNKEKPHEGHMWDLTMWVETRVNGFTTMSLEGDVLCMGGAEGKLRIFNTRLQICDTVYGASYLKKPTSSSSSSSSSFDIVAVCLAPHSLCEEGDSHRRLVVFYANQSVMWIRVNSMPASAEGAPPPPLISEDSRVIKCNSCSPSYAAS